MSYCLRHDRGESLNSSGALPEAIRGATPPEFMRIVPLILLILVLAAPGCVTRAHDPVTAGPSMLTDSSRLAVRGGEIWYRVTGRNSGTPVILLHGGPGLSSHYLKSLEALGDERVVVRYDQLGSGRSDFVTDTALFTIPHFVEQLETLRRHLGMEKVHLYGHSWGATLAVEYSRAHPGRVAGLVLAGSALDFPAFIGSLHRAYTALPDSLYRAVQLREAGEEYNAAHFRAASMEVNSRHAMRRPVPAAEMDSMARSMNTALNEHMTGKTILTPGGVLRDYDATPFLREIAVPVLFLVGEFDFAGPDVIRHHAGLTPGARMVVIPDAGHLVQWDDAPAHLAAVRAFLGEVDGRR
jgi:proline-specific peptidase